MVGAGNPTVWYKSFDESKKRQYNEIDDYKIKVPGEAKKKVENPED